MGGRGRCVWVICKYQAPLSRVPQYLSTITGWISRGTSVWRPSPQQLGRRGTMLALQSLSQVEELLKPWQSPN